MPKPAGGWASRSTSSLSVMIWSRASRRVWASRSFCDGDRGQRALGVGEPQLEAAGVAGRVGQPAAQVGDLGLQEAHLARELVGRAAPAAGHCLRMSTSRVTSCALIDPTRASGRGKSAFDAVSVTIRTHSDADAVTAPAAQSSNGSSAACGGRPAGRGPV